MKAVCVYCGANFNGEAGVTLAVEQLAKTVVSKKIRLIFGGGNVGLMGLIANSVLSGNGQVTGVIPQFLWDREVGHTGLTEMIITTSMHERKQKMADLSDGFIVLPGGFGTLEEFFEVITWLQLGLHNKPIGVLNVNGFYDHLFAQLDVMVSQGFLKRENRALIFNESDPEVLINKMNVFSATPDDKWFNDRNLA